MPCLDLNKFSLTEWTGIGSRGQPTESTTINFIKDAEITADICNGKSHNEELFTAGLKLELSNICELQHSDF